MEEKLYFICTRFQHGPWYRDPQFWVNKKQAKLHAKMYLQFPEYKVKIVAYVLVRR